MMGVVESESLILKSYALSEADKIVVFLTRDHGLLRGVAKGAKRLKSRFGGGLEPFSIVNVSFWQKEERELVTISAIELQKSYFGDAANPEFLQKFAYLSELLLEFAPPNEPNERLYRMAKVCLETASKDPSCLDIIALYFELWVLRLSGYLPDWENCDGCRNKFLPDESVNLQVNFHLLCTRCLRHRPRVMIKPGERRLFLQAQILSPIKFIESAAEKNQEIREVSTILRRIISHILGKENFGERILFAQKP